MIPCPRHPSQRLGLLWRRIACGMIGAVLLSATPGGAAADEFRNSLGMVFHSVKGTDVRFSVWETRVSDWNALLTSANVKWEHRPDFPQDGSHPVVNVMLEDAMDFCDWLTEKERESGLLKDTQSYRLPTNAEWDAAAVLVDTGNKPTQAAATVPQPFFWGTAWPPPSDAGNYNRARIEGSQGDGFEFTAPVGRFKPTVDGIYDLGGNAWEWTYDPAAGEVLSGTLRGSSWMYWRKDSMNPAYRLTVEAETRVPGIGFRCVLEDSDTKSEFESNITAEKKEERDRLMSKAVVSQDEVKQAMMERRLQGTQDKGETSVAAPGRAFVNSLGLKLLPLPGTKVLMGEHEVRAKDYKAFVFSAGDLSTLDPQLRSDLEHPYVGVSWVDAVVFCRWLTQRERTQGTLPQSAAYRLPFKSEWVRAASENDPAGKQRAYPWGSDWPPPPNRININLSLLPGSAQPERMAVKSFPSNALGFYELAGNAAEWCADIGGDLGSHRIYLGGSWKSTDLSKLRVDSEERVEDGNAFPDVGFRLVLELEGDNSINP